MHSLESLDMDTEMTILGVTLEFRQHTLVAIWEKIGEFTSFLEEKRGGHLLFSSKVIILMTMLAIPIMTPISPLT